MFLNKHTTRTYPHVGWSNHSPMLCGHREPCGACTRHPLGLYECSHSSGKRPGQEVQNPLPPQLLSQRHLRSCNSGMLLCPRHGTFVRDAISNLSLTPFLQRSWEYVIMKMALPFTCEEMSFRSDIPLHPFSVANIHLALLAIHARNFFPLSTPSSCHWPR
jgi:hypothetical protein